MGINIGGLGAALDGVQQGVQNTQDRDFLKTQRDFQGQQQQRTQQQWQREDQQRDDMAAIDDNAPEDVQLRRAAAAVKANDPSKWLELHQKADQVMWSRSARQAQDLLASSGSMDAGQLVHQAAQIWNNSNMPVQLANPQYDENSGQVTVDVTSRDTGQTTKRTFANKDELLSSIRALTDPTTYAKLQQTQLEAHVKAQEELTKNPVTSVPGGYVDKKTGQFHATMVGSDVIGYGADGQPIYGSKPASGAGAGGAGGGAGTGKAPAVKANLEDVQGILDKTFGKEDPTVQLQARTIAQTLSVANPTMPAQTIAYVAGMAAKNPQSLKTMVDPATGTIDKVFADPQVNGGRPVRVTSGALKPDDSAMPKEDVEAVRAQVQAMATAWSAPLRTAIMAAAQDPKQMVTLEQTIRTKAQQNNLSPQDTQANIDAARNKVNLARQYLVKPSGVLDAVKRAFTGDAAPAAGGAPASTSVLPKVGGFAAAASYTPPPGSPAAKAAENRARVQQQQQKERAERGQQQSAEQQRLSSSFQADAKTMAPIDLVRKYDKLRFKLPHDDAITLKNIEQKL